MIAETYPRTELELPSAVELPKPVAEFSSEQSRVKLSQPDARLVRSNREQLMNPTEPEDMYRELETIALAQEKNRHPQQQRFAIFLKDGSDLVGGIQIQPSKDGTLGEVSSYSDEVYRRQSYLSDAVLILREHAINTLGYPAIALRMRESDILAVQRLLAEGFREVNRDRFGNLILEFRTAVPATPAKESAALALEGKPTQLAAGLE